MQMLRPLAIDRTYNHGSQVIRAVVIWSCPTGFERLLTISIDLVLVNAVKVFAKNADSSIVVANHDLESGDLVEVERTVVANKERGRYKLEVRSVEIRTLWTPSPRWRVN